MTNSAYVSARQAVSMKIIRWAAVLLASGCATDSYTYLERLQSGTVIQRALYTITVPQSSPQEALRWERYSKDGKSEDLVLKYSVGLVLPSYAATIEVKRGLQLKSRAELESYLARNSEHKDGVDFSKLQPFSTAQPQLLCVRLPAFIDAAPQKAYGFFQHTLACSDSRARHYYELNVSYMTRRKGDIPPADLVGLADHFFASFRVEE